MPDITYRISKNTGHKSEGELSWPEKNLKAKAVSGPFGEGALPAGKYFARRAKLLDKKPTHHKGAYCDSKKKCWMQVLDPDFATSRTELGIHPDGNIPGTEGCIGIVDLDTKAWYDAFYSISTGQSVTVEVL